MAINDLGHVLLKSFQKTQKSSLKLSISTCNFMACKKNVLKSLIHEM